MDLVGRWWNGTWGRLTRRDIWLYRDGPAWLVQLRTGDSDSPVREHRFATEAQARAFVQHGIDTGGSGWKDLTRLYQRDRDDNRP